jgi:thymidylate synthase
MVSAWNPGQISQMVLPPCHYGFQVYTRELSEGERGLLLQPYGLDPLTKEGRDRLWKENNLPTRAISLMWSQRSADAFLGVPFNIASYGLLLEIIAKEVNMVPAELIGNLGDTHLYLNHIEQAKEQIGRELTLEERRELVSQDEFNKVYTGGSPETLSHSEIDQFGVPRRTREPFGLPKLGMDYREGEYNKNLKDFVPDDFYLIDYKSHPTIKAPLSN